MKRFLVLLLFLTACGTARPYVWVSSLPPPDSSSDRVIRVGDHVQVLVAGQEAMSGELTVRPGGEVVLPVAGAVPAAGLTPEALSTQIAARLRGVLADPRVVVVLATRGPGKVIVLGEVRTPGSYPLDPGDGLLDALGRAGGLTQFADEDGIFVVRRTQAAPRVRFRYDDLTGGDPASTRYQLQDGDVVVVE